MVIATVSKCRAVFTRRGYRVTLAYEDGQPYAVPLTVRDKFGRNIMTRFSTDPATFYGNDGRKVRAEAVAYARNYAHIIKSVK